MQSFLTHIDYKTQQLSIIEKSTNVDFFENQEFDILFNSNHTNNISITYLLNSYSKIGINFLKELEGSFSLFLYDKQKQELLIAKDKVGSQPLYFTKTKNSIVVGTHLKKFQQLEEITLTLDPSAVANYMQFGFVLQPNTIFKECYKIESGSCTLFNLKDKNHKNIKYWDLESCYHEPKTIKYEADALKIAEDLLQQSVEESSKNSNFGLSLSGGYDSATLVAIAQSQSNNKVNTFTIGFHEKEIDEAPYAKGIAKHLGTRHHEHYFTAKDALNLIPKMSHVYDEPFADHASSPTMLTAQLLKENSLDNLIAGDGGDEVFATAEDVHFFERLQNAPYKLRQSVTTPLKFIHPEHIPYLKNYNNFPKKYHKLLQILSSKNIPQMILARNTLFLEHELKSQIKEYKEPIITTFDKINFPKDAETVDQIIGTYFKTTMIDGELVKSYSAMNYENITLSMPYLNSQLINHMSQVPSSIKIKDGIKKYLLKEISYKYIPKKLIERPKSGFDIPFSSWMKNELKDILYNQINFKRLDKDNIFYTSSILNIRDQFYAGNDAYKYKLWRIFIFQLWYEAFFSKTLKDKSSKLV